MANNIGSRMVTYYLEELLTIKPHDPLIKCSQRSRNKLKPLISTTTVPSATTFGELVVYLKGLLPIKLSQ